mgnify:CR=1 FL=1
MVIAHYKFKKDLKKDIGNKLNSNMFQETSIFGNEITRNGSFCCTDFNHRWYANIIIKDSIIMEVN